MADNVGSPLFVYPVEFWICVVGVIQRSVEEEGIAFVEFRDLGRLSRVSVTISVVLPAFQLGEFWVEMRY